MTQQDDSFTGLWRCTYWFPSNTHDGEDASEYIVDIHQQGQQLVAQSLPNKIEAYMLVRLSVDDNIVTGTWHETTSPHGEFKGMLYSGAMQLLLNEDYTRMEGKWVGVGRDHAKNTADIYDGRWLLERLPKDQQDRSLHEQK